MNMNLLILLFLIPIQLFPDWVTPTQWNPPTPEPTLENIVVDTSDLIATADATAQYLAVATQTGDEMMQDDTIILPDIENSETQQVFGYLKWMVSSGVQSVLGPFYPLVIPFGLLLSLALISLFVYFWENFITTIIKIVNYIVNFILRMFGR